MTYGSTWVNSSDSESFSINTEKSGTIGITITTKNRVLFTELCF